MENRYYSTIRIRLERRIIRSWPRKLFAMGRSKRVMDKKGLGRGLGALIASAEAPEKPDPFLIDIEKVTPNPFQPRQLFDEQKIDELAASIRTQGVLQPLLVRRNGDGYELVAGERR